MESLGQAVRVNSAMPGWMLTEAKGATKKFHPHWDISDQKDIQQSGQIQRHPIVVPWGNRLKSPFEWHPSRVRPWLWVSTLIHSLLPFPDSSPTIHQVLRALPSWNRIFYQIRTINKEGRIRKAMFSENLNIPLCWTKLLKSSRLGPHSVITIKYAHPFIHLVHWVCGGRGVRSLGKVGKLS